MGARGVHLDLRRSRSYDATCPHSHTFPRDVPELARLFFSRRYRARASLRLWKAYGIIISWNFIGQLMHIREVEKL